jgi:hypothetical protein
MTQMSTSQIEELIDIILTHPTTDLVDLYNYYDVCCSWQSIVYKLLVSPRLRFKLTFIIIIIMISGDLC